ncbi:MAG: ATP synthase F0 subunit B [Polyangiaceae bacterium]|nr:ATP synthase F0 subunit B [Polyangiaceae bacterium]MCW5789053.1 ATP synthase F0 subunit B [Polyangiaceae bacterium]
MPALGFIESSGASPFGVGLLAAIEVDFDLSFILQMVVFAALVVLLKGLLFDRVLKVFEERERRTDGAKAEARAMQERSGELLRRYEAELDRVHQVAAVEREQVRAETAKLEAAILAEAREAVQRIVDHGRERLEAEVRSMQDELSRQSGPLASQIASKVLGRELS